LSSSEELQKPLDEKMKELLFNGEVRGFETP